MPDPKTDTSTFVRSMSRMPAIHRSFRTDPVGTLKTLARGLGVNPDNIDAGTLEMMASLNEEEVRLVEDLSRKAERIPNLADGHDGAIIF